MRINPKVSHIIIIILLTFFAYSNIFPNEFIWDDQDFILTWHETRSMKNLPEFFQGLVHFNHPGVYRPMRSVFYAISYKLWGLNPVGYHFQSILVHLACTILVYLIVAEITKKDLAAFVSALIFGTHPIHTEAVTAITASFDTIGTAFFFASFYLYLRAQSNTYSKKVLYVSSVTSALIAFFTYEMTLTLPLLIALHSLCFNKAKGEAMIKRVKAYSPYFIGALFYVFIRVVVLDIGSRGAYFANSFYLTMLTMTKAFVKYILALIWPLNLNLNHTISKGILSYVNPDITAKAITAQSVFDLEIILAIALILLLVATAIIGFKKYPWLSFCIGWFFIGLSPVSNIIPQSVIMVERYLYIPSFAFCFLLSFAFNHYYNLTPKANRVKHIRIGLIVLFVLLIAGYTSLTLSRNKDWRNSMALWSKTVQQSPDSALAHNNLGIVYDNQGKKELAIEEYKIAVSLNPNYDSAYYNLGVNYFHQGKLDLAVEAYQKAIALDPNYAKVHTNLGIVYEEQGRIEIAIEEHKTAIRIDPRLVEAYNNLAVIYHKLGRYCDAIEEYQKGLAIDPSSTPLKDNLNLAYKAKGDIKC